MRITFITLALVVSALSSAAPEKSAVCYSPVESKVIKRFTVRDIFGKPWGEKMDASLLDDVTTTKETVKFFLTNECDNGFEFTFKARDFERFEQGKTRWLSGTLEYGYPGHVGDPEESMEGTTRIWCRLEN